MLLLWLRMLEEVEGFTWPIIKPKERISAQRQCLLCARSPGLVYLDSLLRTLCGHN